MKKFQPVVLGLIRKNNKYLLTFRIEKELKDNKYNAWQIPGGGLEYGDTVEDTVRRELKEELNVDVEIIQMIPKIFNEIRGDWHGLLIIFLCKLKSQESQVKINFEASEWGWFSFEEIKKLKKMPHELEILEEAEKVK